MSVPYIRYKLLKYLLFVVIAFSIFGYYCVFNIPDVSYLRYINPKTTSFMGSDKESSKINWVPIDRISPELRKAVILAEDELFFEHSGFNPEEIVKAVKINWEAKRFLRGASTITQQLAKNLYLSPKKTPWRKFNELLIALKLERELPKERILEIYLNVIHWGAGKYGIANATQHYFKTTPDKLTREQAAFLAAIIPSPDNYKHRPSFVEEKIKTILSKL